MHRIVVVGAGVVGQVYAGLLARAGNRVSIVARGPRADRLRASGIVLERDGHVVRPPCRVVETIAEGGTADVVIVAVRGDQLPSAGGDVAACDADTVVCMANPLQHRQEFTRRVGAGRTVFAFSGIGGRRADDGVVAFHAVRRQPTVVDVAAARGAAVVRLMQDAGMPVRAETRMTAWLATHSLFIAGIGSALLAAAHGSQDLAGMTPQVREFVDAVSEAFDALAQRGHPVTPASLRTIFGRVPRRLATRYWQRQFAAPLVRLAIEPHIVATRDTEFPQIVAQARDLVGDAAPRYLRLLAR